MSDSMILIVVYLVAALLGGTGMYFLYKQTRNKSPKQQETHAVVATEDMLPGWGKEEEEAKQ